MYMKKVNATYNQKAESIHMIAYKCLSAQIRCMNADLKRKKIAVRSGESVNFGNSDFSGPEVLHDTELTSIYLSLGKLYADILNRDVNISEAKSLFKNLNGQLIVYRKSLK